MVLASSLLRSAVPHCHQGAQHALRKRWYKAEVEQASRLFGSPGATCCAEGSEWRQRTRFATFIALESKPAKAPLFDPLLRSCSRSSVR